MRIGVFVGGVVAAGEKASRILATYNEISSYQRVLALGEASASANVALMRDEKTVAARLRSSTDADGADLIAAPVGLGPDRAESLAWTEEFLVPPT